MNTSTDHQSDQAADRPRHVAFTVLLDAKHELPAVRRLLKRLLRTYGLRCVRLDGDSERPS